jgi:dTDP-4-dehydrorhamnose reductase
MKILLLGANGQVGWELRRSLAPLGQIMACDRTTADLEDLDGLSAIIRDHGPGVIVNAAAYTAVDKAESEPDKARRINADAVERMASEAMRLDATLIHYSTDYVFDGSKSGAYVETDTPGPLSVYGKTKLEGEDAIRSCGCRHMIFRTSWVYAPRGSNFARTMIRLARERDEIRVVADQFGAPTSAELIADITALALYRIAYDPVFPDRVTGTYHLSPAGETSWHGFATYLLSEARKSGLPLRVTPEQVQPITTEEYPLPAPRPMNSRLETGKLSKTLGISLPPWEYHGRRLISELCQRQPL